MTIDLDVLALWMVVGAAHLTTVCTMAWVVARRVLILRAAERAYRIRLARWTAELQLG